MMRFVFTITVALLLFGCVTRHNKPEGVEGVSIHAMICADVFYESYVVRKEDPLWSIARQFQDRDTIDQIIKTQSD